MTNLEPCLVLDASGNWRIEERPPLAPLAMPESQWSSEPTAHYRTKHLLRSRKKMKFLEAVE